MSTSPEQFHYVEVEIPVFLVQEEDGQWVAYSPSLEVSSYGDTEEEGEDGQWVAYSPSLEVSSYGDTEEEAQAAFGDALMIFIEETHRRGSLERELLRMGWTLASNDYYPPQVPPKLIHDFGGRKENRTVAIPAVRPNPQPGFYL